MWINSKQGRVYSVKDNREDYKNIVINSQKKLSWDLQKL